MIKITKQVNISMIYSKWIYWN